MSVDFLTNKINLVLGATTALFSYIFGKHWILFVAFLLLNVGDFVSRWITCRINGTENSRAGWIGILKKLGYWVMIALAFGMSVIFIEIGNTIGIDLEVTTFIGYFVLATLIINECRSILENLVEGGFRVPSALIKGLEVANNAIDGKIKIGDEGIETIFHKPEKEIRAKGKATLEVEDHRTKPSEGD